MQINELEGRLTGLPEEGERIKLHLVKLNDLWRSCPDAKALSALTLFHGGGPNFPILQHLSPSFSSFHSLSN